MKYKATLTCFNSRMDGNGNRYFAFSYTDHVTGKVINGKISGGESNIYAIKGSAGKALHGVNGWNDEIAFNAVEMLIRPYNRMVKDWEYAGCRPETLAQFIKDELEK